MSKQTFINIYSTMIHPVLYKVTWDSALGDPILPPNYSKKAERPIKRRVREEGEAQASNRKWTKKYTKCKRPGHNK